MKKINLIDLFAGCGGLLDGFKQTGTYESLACVEWDKEASDTLIQRLESKWGYKDASSRVLRFDLQQTDRLLNGWDDAEYGFHNGLISTIGRDIVDLIIGGPPCQAYSIAGRIRDEHGMHYDYRNYLFESYLEIVKFFTPKIFIFENVPGMLSARPGGVNIIESIRQAFAKNGFTITDNLKDEALIELSEYGVPQKRKRVIILGINDSYFSDYQDKQKIISCFYQDILPKYKKEPTTVRDAIYDLPRLYPLAQIKRWQGRRYSHDYRSEINGHQPRMHNERDIDIFNKLAKDIEEKRYQYITSDALIDLYYRKTGRKTNIHKYHVLRWDEQSNTIPAHLYKDGLRHIHPDSQQARSITVREAARLQSFPDDFMFNSSMTHNYKMIGNAVPPLFAKALGRAIYDFFCRYGLNE